MVIHTNKKIDKRLREVAKLHSINMDEVGMIGMVPSTKDNGLVVLYSSLDRTEIKKLMAADVFCPGWHKKEPLFKRLFSWVKGLFV